MAPKHIKYLYANIKHIIVPNWFPHNKIHHTLRIRTDRHKRPAFDLHHYYCFQQIKAVHFFSLHQLQQHACAQLFCFNLLWSVISVQQPSTATISEWSCRLCLHLIFKQTNLRSFQKCLENMRLLYTDTQTNMQEQESCLYVHHCSASDAIIRLLFKRAIV